MTKNSKNNKLIKNEYKICRLEYFNIVHNKPVTRLIRFLQFI